jgi:predicted secreted protein
MTLMRSEQVTLSVGNGLSPETYLPLGGLVESELEWSSRPVPLTSLAAGAWQQVAEDSGKRSVILQGRGLFEASAGEARLVNALHEGQAVAFRIDFGAQRLEGQFQVTRYARRTRRGGIVEARLMLESSGMPLLSNI